jgi:ATP-dependent helicase HrpB
VDPADPFPPDRLSGDPERLPVEEVIGDIRRLLSDDRYGILVAPPGSGKTTIVPLRLLQEPWLDGRRIVVLEPRRLATRAAAQRMARLLDEAVGGTVGYTTRDERRVSADTRIEVVTEGILTRRLQNDPELPGTGLILFDEFHERNLQTDLGLALAVDVQQSIRPDLRILLMSATIDADHIATTLSGHLDRLDQPVEIVTSDAREHPIEIRHTSGGSRRGKAGRRARPGRWNDPVPAVVELIHRALDDEVGDVLVFLPGMGEIARTADRLEHDGVAAEIHRLHGSLSLDEQAAALAPSMRRKVVLSTDIAETSLTVEGVRIVVDSGLARSPRLDIRTGMTRLQTVSISQASADQRAGRAGRTEPGVAYRAWSKMEQATRPAQRPAEITQVDLSGLMLELRTWGVRQPDALFFLDPPSEKHWTEAEGLLVELGAIDAERGDLTELGRRMTAVPTHPRLARMILESETAAEQRLACILAALIDERDPLSAYRPNPPTDLGLRVRLVTGGELGTTEIKPSLVDQRVLRRVRRNADDIGRRIGLERVTGSAAGVVDSQRAGRVLALAYPDRLATARGSRGRFQLRTRTTAWMANSDSLAGQRFLIAADLDGKRKDSRIRLAAALDEVDVFDRFADAIETQIELEWDNDRVMEHRRSRIGGVILAEGRRRAQPGPDTAGLVADRLRRNPELLDWSARGDGSGKGKPAAEAGLRHRVQLLHQRRGEPWPDWSDEALVSQLDDWPSSWLASTLLAVTSIDELNRFGPNRILEQTLDPRLRPQVDQLCPTHVELPGGRRVPVDYQRDRPTISSRVQDFFGLDRTPEVAGEPVVVELLSPARRPVQVTTDLAGFWSGSWAEVRKDMAGRYPKHDWPENPGL